MCVNVCRYSSDFYHTPPGVLITLPGALIVKAFGYIMFLKVALLLLILVMFKSIQHIIVAM
jgi:hypothetical protein